ncbi:MAG: hypothetical protein IT376_17405 [Polyangiaceae bacterium]|nr:hypothetical protein [Polyangiaceae bacterium]
MRRAIPWAWLVCAGCGSELLPPGVAVLTSGHEPDPWGEAPAPIEARIGSERADGSRALLATPEPPLKRFSLGYRDPMRFLVAGLGEAGDELVCARSVEVDPVGLAALELPLFVARSGALARPPGSLSAALARASVAVGGGRVILAAGGTPEGRLIVDGYDLATWSPVASTLDLECPAMPCEVTSLLVVDGALALVLGDNWAVSLDLAEGAGADLPPPAGLASWADLAAGRSIPTSDGGGYVVGGTRVGAPTAAVLRADADGQLRVLSLAAPRAGAAAAWVAGRGLVVAGGSATGPGVELLSDGAGAFVSLPFPPDATVGAALVPADTATAVRLGGSGAAGEPAPSATLALGCSGDACVPLPAWPDVPLTRAEAYPLPGGDALATGADATGAWAAWHVGPSAATPVALREARTGAASLAIPTGHVAILGGRRADGTAATTLELYTPPGLCAVPSAAAGE